MVTGLVAGGVIYMAQQWHDFEQKADWGELLMKHLKVYRVTEVEARRFRGGAPSPKEPS